MRIRFLWLLALTSVGMAANVRGTFKQDLTWKRYADPVGNYCLEYPKHWIRQELPDGSGVGFSTGAKRYSLPTGEMDVTVLATPDDATDLLQAHLDGMKKFARASDIELLGHETVMLAGSQAMYSKDRYRDSLDKADWTEEIILARHDDKTYRLEMMCRSDQVARFELMFGRMVRSFAFGCNRK